MQYYHDLFLKSIWNTEIYNVIKKQVGFSILYRYNILSNIDNNNDKDFAGWILDLIELRQMTVA